MNFSRESNYVSPTTTSQVGALSMGPSRYTHTPLGVVTSPSWVPFSCGPNHDQLAASWTGNGTTTSPGVGQSGISYNFGAVPTETAIFRTPEYFAMPKNRRPDDPSKGEIAATEASLGLSAPGFRGSPAQSIVASSGITVPVLSTAINTGPVTSSGGLNPDTPRYSATNGGNVSRNHRYRRLNVTEGEGTVTKPQTRFAPYQSLVKLSDLPNDPIQPFVKWPDIFKRTSPTTSIDEDRTSLSGTANSHAENLSSDRFDSFCNISADSLSRESDKLNFLSKFASELQQSHSKVPPSTSVSSSLNGLSKPPILSEPSQKFPSVDAMRGPKGNSNEKFQLDTSTEVRNFLANGVSTKNAFDNKCSTPNKQFKMECSEAFSKPSNFGKKPPSRKIAASFPNFQTKNLENAEKKEDENYGSVLKPVLEDILEQQKLIATYLNASDAKKFGFPPESSNSGKPSTVKSQFVPPVHNTNKQVSAPPFFQSQFTQPTKQDSKVKPSDFSNFRFNFPPTVKPEATTVDLPAAPPASTSANNSMSDTFGLQKQLPAGALANFTAEQLQQFLAQEFEKLVIDRDLAKESKQKESASNMESATSAASSMQDSANATKKSVWFDLAASNANTPASSEHTTTSEDIMRMMQSSFKTALQQMIEAGCIVRPSQAPTVETQDAAIQQISNNQSTPPASSNASADNRALTQASSYSDPSNTFNGNSFANANPSSHNTGSPNPAASGNTSHRNDSWQRDCGIIADPVERQLLDRSGVYTGGLPHLKHINSTANHSLGLDSIPQSQFLVHLDASSVAKFSGNMEDFEDFHAAFMAYAQAIPEKNRLHILRTKLDDDSKSLISGCLSKDAGAFEQAMGILESFHGNEDQLVQLLVSKIQESFDYRAKNDHYRFKVMVSKIRECYARIYKIDPFKCSYLNGNINSLYACVPPPVEKRMTLEIFMNKKVPQTFGKALDICEDQLRYENSRVVSLRAAHNLRARSSSSDRRSSSYSSEKHKQSGFFKRKESSYCAESDTDSNAESVITAAEQHKFTSKKSADRGRSKSRDQASAFRSKSKSVTRAVERCSFCNANDHNTLFCEKEVPDIAKLVSSLRLCWLCFSNQHFSGACLANETRAKMLQPFKCTESSCKPEPHNLRLCQK